ncbi:hypothetical protein ACFO0N_21900 [Halobium salinum]|uniref:HNH endonuclease n=1 Tax=Halobium salinum TaxID=1364940 RepID=A0ABD5PID4_9EURY|nr:hypothetical protein [Halobium salinum]
MPELNFSDVYVQRVAFVAPVGVAGFKLALVVGLVLVLAILAIVFAVIAFKFVDNLLEGIEAGLDEPITKPAEDSDPDPEPEPGDGPRPLPLDPRWQKEACDELLISWPIELPNPYDVFGGPVGPIRIKSSERDLYGLGPRGSAQRRLNNRINEAREAMLPPPEACFSNSDPIEYYDAHHIHPLFLAGVDSDENLCAVETRRHHQGHDRLQHQPEWLDYYVQCGEESDDLYQHESLNTYVIVDER